MNKMLEKVLFFIWEAGQHLLNYMPEFTFIKLVFCATGVFISFQLYRWLTQSGFDSTIEEIFAVLYITSVLMTTLVCRSNQQGLPIVEAMERQLLSIRSDFFHAKYEILFNIMMFFPMGILLKKKKLISATLIGLCISSSIEFLQMLTHRGQFELFDIAENTIGTFIGKSIFILLTYIATAKRTGVHHD